MPHYFLGSRLLASTPSSHWWADDQLSVRSEALFCPTCGEVWGRVMQDGLPWTPVIRHCSKHGSGSFIAPWRQGAPRELPAEVLAYELQLRLNNPEVI